MKLKKQLFSFLLVFLQIFIMINPVINPKKMNTVKAASIDTGWIQYDPTTKQFEIKIEGMIPTEANKYYEYDIFGFVVRYHKNDGTKFLTQIVANGSDQTGFTRIEYDQFWKDSVLYERSRNVLSLENLKKFFEKDFPGYDFSEITNPTQNSSFKFDAIYSVKRPGESNYRGYVDSNRVAQGEYYMTLSGSHLYNVNDYRLSSKYTPTSYYDHTKGGILGSKLYDTGIGWYSIAVEDIKNNYNKSVTILASQKPNVDKTVVTNYVNLDTGKMISSSDSKTYSIGSTAQPHTSNAKTISGYNYLYYKVDTGGGLSGEKSGTSASISVNATNSKHEITFYYSKSTFDKDIIIKLVDDDRSVELSKTTVVQNISGNFTYSHNAPTMNGYKYRGYRVNYGSGLSALNTSSTGQINLNLSNSYYEIVFYYNSNSGSSPNPSGKITFNPNNSNWLNKDIPVKLSVSGDTEIKRTGTQIRSYSYTTRDWINGYYTTKIENGQLIEVWVPGKWGNYYTVNSSISCEFEQIWEIDKINVSVSSAKDINGDSIPVDLSTNSVLNNGSTIIQSDANDIVLKANLNDWKEKSKTWSNVSAPNGGTWGSTQITATTPKPTEKYTSYSGRFKLDKSKPVIESVSSPNSNWVNKNQEVRLNFTENLSGLDTCYGRLTDVSYLKNPQINMLLFYSVIDRNYKLNYYYHVLDKDGIYNLDAHLVDMAGNFNDKKQESYKIDKTRPNDTTFSADTREYIDDPLNVQIGFSDNLSGISKVELAVTNSIAYSNEPKQLINVTTRENVKDDMAYYNYEINKNGTYYFHVWSYDRAGNMKYTVSKEYKYFKINPDDISINPFANNGKAMRGTRFDIITEIENFTKRDFDNSKLVYTMPNWINDDVNNKTNGKYSITTGFGAETIAKEYSDNNEIQLWDSYITPFGTPLTYDKNGNKIGNNYQVNIDLLYEKYAHGPNKTHTITLYFDVIPEQVVKTQILENNK